MCFEVGQEVIVTTSLGEVEGVVEKVYIDLKRHLVKVCLNPPLFEEVASYDIPISAVRLKPPEIHEGDLVSGIGVDTGRIYVGVHCGTSMTTGNPDGTIIVQDQKRARRLCHTARLICCKEHIINFPGKG